MKRYFVLFLTAVLIITSLNNTIVLASSDKTTTKKAAAKESTSTEKKKKSTTQKEVWPKGPKVNAKSAILMDVSSGLVLYEKNSHKTHYPASITKIMTTLLAIENCSMGEIVTFSHDSVYGIEPGSSHIGINEGEKLTIEQSLYAIMLASANEVSWGVGEHISGTLSAFASAMTERAKALGCKNTNFVNANGLHDDKHYTTAYDMALIAREAIKYNTFRKIISTRSYAIPPTNKHKKPNAFSNHHQMLCGNKYPQYKYEYCIGGKTGYTTKAGSTLVTFAEKNGIELVCVVMRANGPASTENEYTDSTSLFDWAFKNFTQYDIKGETQSSVDTESPFFTKYNPIFDSAASPLRLGENTTILLPNGVDLNKAKRNIEIYDNTSLLDGENIIGNVSYSYGNKTVGSTDIIFNKEKITQLSAVSQTNQKESSSVKKADMFNLKPIIIIAILIIIAVCVFLYFYFTKKRKNRNTYYNL